MDIKAVSMSGALNRAARPKSKPKPSYVSPDPFVNELLTLTNRYRSSLKIKPLKLNRELTQSAQLHAQAMATLDFFGHTSLDGSTPIDRARANNYNYFTVGENIGAGLATPQSVLNAWIASPPHKANLRGRIYKDIGIGFYFLPDDTGTTNYRYYWVQDFGVQLR